MDGDALEMAILCCLRKVKMTKTKEKQNKLHKEERMCDE